MRLMGRTLRLPASPVSPLESRGGWVQRWLGRELESRGIDAVVYTRYVLSLLLRDDVCAVDDDAHLYPPPKLPPHRRRSTPRSKRPLTTRRRTTSAGGSGAGDSEQMKKTAAVECLLSVSDEDSGIESLVDELYTKLKEQASEANDASNKIHKVCHNGNSKPELEDPAEKYYAAFPALSDKSAALYVSTPASAPAAMPCDWAKVAQMSPDASATPVNHNAKPELKPDDVCCAVHAATEDQTWYTDPLDDMLLTTSTSRPPLYARQSPATRILTVVRSPVTIVDPDVWACDGSKVAAENTWGWPESFKEIALLFNETALEKTELSVDCSNDDVVLGDSTWSSSVHHYLELSVDTSINDDIAAIEDAVVPSVDLAAECNSSDGDGAFSLHFDAMPTSESTTAHCVKRVDDIIADWGPGLAVDDVIKDHTENHYEAFSIDSFVLDFTNGIKNHADSFGSVSPAIDTAIPGDSTAFTGAVEDEDDVFIANADDSFGTLSWDVGCDACGSVLPCRRLESPCKLTPQQVLDAAIPASTENDVLDHRPCDQTAAAVDQLFGSCDSDKTLVASGSQSVQFHDLHGGNGGNLLQSSDWLTQPLDELHSDAFFGDHCALGCSDGVQGLLAGWLTPGMDAVGWGMGYNNHVADWEGNVQQIAVGADPFYMDGQLQFDMDSVLKPSPLWDVKTSPHWGCRSSPPWTQYESSLLHIQHCLLGVRFELPHQRSGSFIQGGVYGCDSTWSPPSLTTHAWQQQQQLPRRLGGSTTAIGWSANTAFRSQIPPRLKHLPHVHSAPCLSPGQQAADGVDSKRNGWLGRLVQIRHLYKSDSSILQQLGLATPSSPQSSSSSSSAGVNITEISSDRHFKPIRTDENSVTPVPLDIFSPVQSASSAVRMTPAYQPYGSSGNFVPRFRLQQDEREKFSQTDTIADIWPDTHMPHNTSIWADNVISLSPTTKKEMESMHGNEKCTEERSFGAAGCLGTTEVENTTANSIAFTLGEAPFANIPEIFLHESEEENFIDSDTVPTSFTHDDTVLIGFSSVDTVSKGFTHSHTLSTGFAHTDAVAKGFTYGDTVSTDFAHTDAVAKGFIHSDTVLTGFTYGDTVSTGFAHTDAVAKGFIHSDTVLTGFTYGDTLAKGFTHSDTVGKGFTNEDDVPKLFPYNNDTTGFTSDTVLKGLNDDDTVPKSFAYDDPFTNRLTLDDSLNKSFTLSDTVSTDFGCDENVSDKNGFVYDKDDHKVFSFDECGGFPADQTSFTSALNEHDSMVLQDCIPPLPPPGGHAMYSSELEKQWLQQSEKLASYAPRKRTGSTSSKPCTFFMEANCRRSDCKYSHDIAAIPCRFWQEGDCFKGDMCPFLHGYTPCDSPHDVSPALISYKDRVFSFEEDFPELEKSQPSKGDSLPRTGGRRQRAVRGFGTTHSQPISIKMRPR